LIRCTRSLKHMIRSIHFYSLVCIVGAIGFFVGVATRTFFVKESDVALFISAILLFAVMASFWKKKKGILLGCSIFFFMLGVWRMDSALEEVHKNTYAGEEIRAVGFIAQEPKITQFSSRLTVRLRSCEENLALCQHGKVLVYGDRWETYQYGEEIQLQCHLKVPKNFSEDFDWRMFLAKDHIYYECENPVMGKTGNMRGNDMYRKLLELRKKMEHTINIFIPQPEAALGSGLLFGGSSRLSEEVQEDFAKTSMTHIVAVSGYNVSILSYYFLILGIAIGLKRQRAFWFAALGIFVFVAMIGFPPSAIP